MTQRRHLLLTALWCALRDQPTPGAQDAVAAVRESLSSWRSALEDESGPPDIPTEAETVIHLGLARAGRSSGVLVQSLEDVLNVLRDAWHGGYRSGGVAPAADRGAGAGIARHEAK